MSCAVKKYTYQRRRPEETPCYKIVQAELSTFIQQRHIEGRPLPSYITDEFEAYLRCGILAHGFLRLKCESCKEEKVTAFSCKRRGFCPSCCGKRMAEAAAHLVDNILPIVPYRQFVVTFPHPMRYWLNTNKQLFSEVHHIITENIQKYYKSKTNIPKIYQPKTGIVSFTQRFGSAANLNPHLHIIATDGMHYRPHNPLFRKSTKTTEKQVAKLLENIIQDILTLLKTKGYLNSQGELVENPLRDSLFTEYESINMATGASLLGRIAFGPNAGKKVTRLGGGFGYLEEKPLFKGKLCCTMNGFSLHAARAINTHNRKGLEQLISYIARGPFSNERLTLVKGNKVKLALKRPFTDGTTHLLMTYSEFMEKLTALIPQPKSHLVRWSGSLAPNSKYRRKIILNPDEKKGFDFEGEDNSQKNCNWVQLLARVFGIDVLACPCGGKFIPLGALKEPPQIKRYLKHVGLEYLPPPRAPPRCEQIHILDLDQTETNEELPVIQMD